MKGLKKQKGASIIGLIIGLAFIGVLAFVGLQYIPQYIESGTVGSMLDAVARGHKSSPFRSVNDVQKAIDKQLTVNQMDDLKERFVITPNGSSYTITVSYERELDLGYKKKVMQYEKSVILN